MLNKTDEAPSKSRFPRFLLIFSLEKFTVRYALIVLIFVPFPFSLYHRSLAGKHLYACFSVFRHNAANRTSSNAYVFFGGCYVRPVTVT